MISISHEGIPPPKLPHIKICPIELVYKYEAVDFQPAPGMIQQQANS